VARKATESRREPRRAIKLTAMQRLEYEKQAIQMSWEGMYAYQIAEALGVHESTVDRLLKAARARIEPLYDADVVRLRHEHMARFRERLRHKYPESSMWDDDDDPYPW
jgi:DNA-directed RNA polymerase specialized sigma24 family protein